MSSEIPRPRDPWDDDPNVAKIAAQDAEQQRRRDWPYTGLEQLGARPLGSTGVDPFPTQQPLIVNVEQPRHSTYVEPPNHVLHGVLTVATGLLWAPVWFWRVRKYRKAMRKANR